MAKELEQVKKHKGQDVLLYKVWLRNNWERLTKAFGQPLAVVLLILAAVFVLVFVLLLEVAAIGLVVGLIWYLSPVFTAGDSLPMADRKDMVQGVASTAQATALGLAGAVGFIGLIFTWRSLRQTRQATERTLELTQQGQITERFTKAIEQLGGGEGEDKTIELRLGGIYALERIAKEFEQDYGVVMEVLSAYVREHAPRQRTALNEVICEQIIVGKRPSAPPPRSDIQAILTVIGRCISYDNNTQQNPLDLHETDLHGAQLRDANLVQAIFVGADLRGIFLVNSNLTSAILASADLSGAVLAYTSFEKAILSRADLRWADLTEAYLGEADLRDANFEGADLRGANLEGADLRNAKGFLVEHQDQAKSLKGAKMPDGWKHL
jgi:hypothetical protein